MKLYYYIQPDDCNSLYLVHDDGFKEDVARLYSYELRQLLFDRKVPECRIEYVCEKLRKVLELLNKNEIKNIIIFTYTGFKVEIPIEKLRIESFRKFESTYIIDLDDKEVEIVVKNMQINVYEKPKIKKVEPKETRQEGKRFEIYEVDLSDEEWNKLINVLKKVKKGVIKILRIEKDFVDIIISSYRELHDVLFRAGFRPKLETVDFDNRIVRIYRKNIVFKFFS